MRDRLVAICNGRRVTGFFFFLSFRLTSTFLSQNSHIKIDRCQEGWRLARARARRADEFFHICGDPERVNCRRDWDSGGRPSSDLGFLCWNLFFVADET